MKKFNLIYSSRLVSSLKKGIPILFILIMNFFPFASIFSQNEVYQCGFYDRDASRSNNDFSGDYFDQFGNNYTELELKLSSVPENILPVQNCVSGYFNLIFAGPFEVGEIQSVCAAFDYLSGVIIPVSPTTQVNIMLTKEYMQDADSKISESILATGQAFFRNECGINRSLAYLAVNSEELNTQFIHGIIRYNQFITNWHLVPNDGPNPQPNISGIDMFSVTVHEALHVFAWHSLTHDPDEQPIFDGHYSVFDRFLRHNVNGTKRNFLIHDPQPGCCNKHILNPELGPISSAPSVCDKVTFESFFHLLNVPVGSPEASLNNHLAHFFEGCPPSPSYFVMHPSISSNQNKRNISDTEKTAMCAMGFSIAGSCAENECIVVANDDGPIIINELNTPIILNSSLYLDNDNVTFNDNPALFTVTHVDSCGNLQGCSLEEGILVEFDIQSQAFTITAYEPGFYSICYSISANCGFGSKCDDAIIYLYVDNPDEPSCCDDPNTCLLICNGLFDEIESNIELRQDFAKGDNNGETTMTFGQAANQPVLITGSLALTDCNDDPLATVPMNSSGNGVRLNHSLVDSTLRKDGIYLTLCTPLEPGSTLNIELDAIASPDCFGGSAELYFELSSCMPIGGVDVYDTPGMIAGPEIIAIATGTSLNPYTVAIENTSNEPARYLYIHHHLNLTNPSVSPFRSYVVIDDVVAYYEESCLTITPAGVLPNTPCPDGKVSATFNVCNTCSNLHGDIDVTVVVPELMDLVPTGSVPSQSFTIPAGSIHPNTCQSFEVLVDVGDDESVFDVLQDVIMHIDDLDSCTTIDSAILHFTPIEDMPLTISKELVWQDTVEQTGTMRFRIIVCNESDYTVNGIEVEDDVSYLIKVTETGDFSKSGQGLYKLLQLDPHSCDTLFFEGIPICICQDSMENCARARILYSGCWDIYDCVPMFDDIRTGPKPDPGFWVTYTDCYFRCFGWEPNECDDCQENLWDFGDGNTSTSFFPCHTYADQGEYLVTHTTFNLCGDTMSMDTIHIWEYRPDPGFTYDFEEECGDVSFYANEQEWEHTWDFGNGMTSTDPNPEMHFEHDGWYTIIHCVRHDILCDWQCDTIQLEIFCGRYCDCPNEVGNFNFGTYDEITNLSTAQFATGSSHDNTGNCISFRGKVVVDMALFAINGGEIRMHPGTEIEIPTGNRLELTNIDENGGIHGCDTLWNTIRVQPDGELFMLLNLVQDAYSAVTHIAPSFGEIRRNEFRNNHVGITLQGQTSLFNPMSLDATVFNGNVFRAPNALLPSFSSGYITGSTGQCGVNIRNTIALIGSDAPDNSPYQNIYEQMDFGVIVTNAWVIILSQLIADLNPYTNTSFSKPIGILAFDSVIRAERNKLSNISRSGIELSKPLLFNIRRNIVDDAKNGIFVLNHSLGGNITRNKVYKTRFGIILDGIKGVSAIVNRVDSNKVYLNYPFVQTVYGISVFKLPGIGTTYSNVVSSNEVFGNVTNLESVITLYRIEEIKELGLVSNYAEQQQQNKKGTGFNMFENKGSVVTGNYFKSGNSSNTIAQYTGFNFKGCSDSQICCNDAENATEGFQFNQESACRLDHNLHFGTQRIGLNVLNGTMIGRQHLDPSTFNPIVQGNEWTGTFTNANGWGANNFNSLPAVLNNSLIYYNPSYPATATFNNHQYSVSDPEGDWFKPRNDSDPLSCEADTICTEVVIRERASDEYAVQGLLVDTINDWTALNWEVLRNLWRKARLEPTIGNTSAIVDSFLTHAAGEMPALVENLEFEMDSIRRYSASDQILVGLFMDTIQAIESQIGEKDSLLAFATTYVDSINLSQSKVSVLTGLEYITSQMFIMDSIYRERLEQAITGWQSEVASWQPNGIVETNYRDFYQLYLKHMAAPDSMLTSTELNLLLDIGEQCPEVGGHVVWQARTLLENWMEVTWVDDELCNASPILSSTPKASSPQRADMRVYPVPTSNQVFVILSGDVAMVRLEIYDMTGRIVKQLQLDMVDNVPNMDVSLLPSGNYRVKAILANGDLIVKPLVIVR